MTGALLLLALAGALVPKYAAAWWARTRIGSKAVPQ